MDNKLALWTSDDAQAATGGTVTVPWQASGVSIDTRTLVPGDLFVALRDVRDGHDFVAQALEKGAAAALVDRVPDGVAADAPLLVVPDVLAALTDLGRAGRARSAARVIGVTGSVGKTSSKEMLRAVLARQGRVHAAEASYNNHWGVPLTLARMPADAEFAVIEIGMNHPGEIAPLAQLARPHVAMITTIAPAHLEAFDDIHAIASEKISICQGLEPGGAVVLPLDLETSDTLQKGAGGARVITFGASERADWRLLSARIAQDVTVVRARTPQGEALFKVATPGRHFAMNALAVLATAAAVGADPALAAIDIGAWAPPAGRGMRERIMLDALNEALSFDLIDDAYNANPTSVAASLDVLATATPRHGVGRVKNGRRIAILGDMLELGPQETALHAAIAAHPALAAVDIVHCVGPRMHALWTVLPEGKRGQWTQTAPEMVARAHQLVDAGDIVLIKGSKGIKVSLLVDAMRKLGQVRAPEPTGDQ
ncbi:MAG: UDP-N-acetylmuramoyl-tripeptide--D-alanyl-D-alanine ligase [Gemmobacter sp.]|nr:UDP-N-acetylmuramoyl-tripeptide--D-alanyl-D-alanine ligase [Gemmobacter sp.]